MLKKVKHLQDKWIDEGKPKIEIGIGISSGEAFIGNIGSVDRLEYTVIGDTVNTASLRTDLLLAHGGSRVLGRGEECIPRHPAD